MTPAVNREGGKVVKVRVIRTEESITPRVGLETVPEPLA